jgi:hypothetical protein
MHASREKCTPGEDEPNVVLSKKSSLKAGGTGFLVPSRAPSTNMRDAEHGDGVAGTEFIGTG